MQDNIWSITGIWLGTRWRKAPRICGFHVPHRVKFTSFNVKISIWDDTRGRLTHTLGLAIDLSSIETIHDPDMFTLPGPI